MKEKHDGPQAVPGLVTIPSPFSAAVTMTRLESLVKSHGLRIFAKIDFAADAAREGLAMPPMVQLVFGNPKAGTPLMLAAPTIGIDLPLKVLVWEDAAGTVWLSYNDPAALAQRHQLPSNLIQNIAGIRRLVGQTLAPDAAPASKKNCPPHRPAIVAESPATSRTRLARRVSQLSFHHAVEPHFHG